MKDECGLVKIIILSFKGVTITFQGNAVFKV